MLEEFNFYSYRFNKSRNLQEPQSVNSDIDLRNLFPQFISLYKIWSFYGDLEQ